MDIKVSVIIPVYNAEKYLEECINSLLSQTLQECEFIFINDGSLDKSKKIIERYQKDDHRIILFNQENQGVSVARNQGIELALGEYIGFVDADDYVEKDMFETLYNAATIDSCDIIFSNFINYYKGVKSIIKFPFPINKIVEKEIIKKMIIPYFLEKDDCNNIWSKIYKKEIIINNRISFQEGINFGEDALFNMNCLALINKLRYINYSGYHYREVEGSASNNIFQNNYFEKAIEVYNRPLPIELINIFDYEMNELKSVKLIKSVMSYIHMYCEPRKDFNFMKKYKCIKKMIDHENVRNSLLSYYKLHYYSSGRYEKLLYGFIKKKFVFGLFAITAYSRLKNN